MKSQIKVSLLLLISFVYFFPAITCSHPHVFLENSLTIVFDENGLAGIQVRWVFDEFFASMIAGDYDQNHNGRFENEEITDIKKEAFDNLANFQYFSVIKIDKKPFEVKYVREFSASLSNGKMIYKFYIPCHVKAAPGIKTVIISQYDPTYYTRIAFSKDHPITFQGDSIFETNYRIVKNREEAYYFDQIYPIELIFNFKLKNG